MPGRRVALCLIDGAMLEEIEWRPFSFGAYRVLAAARAAFPDDEVRLFHGQAGAVEALAAELEAFDPELVGASSYLWSFPSFVELAGAVKRRRPDCTVVFGGPSAHPAMFALPRFRDGARFVDGLITREGEEAFCDLLRLPSRDPESLRRVPGLAARTPFGFAPAPPRDEQAPLDALPSPFGMRLAPAGVTGHLETFRGCPLSCAFCEWGVADRPTRVASQAWLERELSTLRDLGLPGAFLVDAGLNLNSRAFHNFAAAERAVGFFRTAELGCEVYPDYLRDEHLEFLAGCRVHHIGVGLQSSDPETLALMQRKFDLAKFRRSVELLAEVQQCTVEIIFGLPGDSPESFRRTLDLALALPGRVNVLAYHCLVLPDGLMTRAPDGSAIEFDPESLLLSSCRGWPKEAIERTRRELDALVAAVGGRAGSNWWHLKGSPAPARAAC